MSEPEHNCLSDLPRLSSGRHPLAVQIRKIVNRPQHARRHDQLLLDGVHLFEEVIKTDLEPVAILASPQGLKNERFPELLSAMCRRGWPLFSVPDRMLTSLSPVDSPQGLLGLFERPAPPSLPKCANTRTRFLLLDRLQDPGNLGMLARTATAFGFDGLLTLPDTCDPYHIRAMRASSGQLLHLPVFPAMDDVVLDNWIAAQAVQLLAFVAHHGTPLSDLDNLLPEQKEQLGNKPVCLVLGAEGTGLAPETRERCSLHWQIPLKPQTESLGVAAAGTLGLFLLNQI
jgi:RNA methyltransferase, TrmH family